MDLLNRLRFDSAFMANVTAWETLPPRPARYAPFPAALRSELVQRLPAVGITALYTHQAQAIEAILRGENVVIATGTASGKTLCYNLPVLQHCLADPQARALYLFPTKALAQDQFNQLAEWAAALASPADPAATLALPAVHLYDGDTPAARRPAIRKSAGLLFSNPDMLHTGILPHHPQWADWLAQLKFVVLDELHTYRGVFGSHCANVLRRLKRLCAFYGAAPQFIAASATIANPRELAEKLVEAPVTLVDADGSPRAEKHLILYNPPVVEAASGLRRSYLLETQKLAGAFLAAGAPLAVFARTRNTTEVLLGYVRDEAQARGLDPQTVRGYRGGYLPNERREIERGLRAGTVRGVVATNALELGIDIGQLGAVIMAGYPGTLASFWQQGGRAGRRAETSAVVLVASSAPLDQYLVTHPRYLFENSPERALINPDNLALLAQHLRCAAFELPFRAGEAFGAAPAVAELLQALAEEGDLHAARGTYHWVAAAYPAAEISLRSATAERVIIQTVGAGRPVAIGEVDRITAPLRVHAGAVYLHEGKSFVITQLDWENGLAAAQATEVDYFTEASENVEIKVINSLAPLPPEMQLGKGYGDLLITSQPVYFRQIKRYTHENLGHGDIDLPAREFQTTGYWLWFAPELVEQLARAGIWVGPNHYGPDWERQRQAALRRDGYRCRRCGAGRSAGRELDVHHQTPFRTFGYIPGVNTQDQVANDLSNLITLCRVCHRRVETARGTQTALGGLANVLGNLAPLFLMCDPRDLGQVSEQQSAFTQAPTITLYDQIPEGLGLARQLYDLHADLLRAGLELVSTCPCLEGCPACVGPVGLEGAPTKDLTRRLAEQLVALL